MDPTRMTATGDPAGLSIQHAITGEFIGQWSLSEVRELRVWELKRLLFHVTMSAEYFAWQLHNGRCPLKDELSLSKYGNMEQGLCLFATKRQLRLPTLDEQADLEYYVSICHRRKLWKLISKGIQVTTITGGNDRVGPLVRAIEANYVEPSEDYKFPNTVQTLLWAQCDPNQPGTDQRLPLHQAIRSGDDYAVELLLRSQANPNIADIGNEMPLSLAAGVGAPSYMRLLLQFRACPTGSEGTRSNTGTGDNVATAAANELLTWARDSARVGQAPAASGTQNRRSHHY